MLKEIDNDFYCSAGYEFTDMEDGNICPMQLHLEEDDRDCKNCGCCKHKHPTTSQFKEEYGFDVPDDMPVWFVNSDDPEDEWILDSFYYVSSYAPKSKAFYIVVACTPFIPSNSWRPKI